jgi:hypothetical protein
MAISIFKLEIYCIHFILKEFKIKVVNFTI